METSAGIVSRITLARSDAETLSVCIAQSYDGNPDSWVGRKSIRNFS